MLQTVTSLALCSNDIKGAAVEALVSGLANNSVLTQLDLSHNPIGNPGAKMLAGLLVYRKQHKQGLRELSLCGCDLGDSGASALFHAVAQGAGNRQLQVSALALASARPSCPWLCRRLARVSIHQSSTVLTTACTRSPSTCMKLH